MSSLTIVVRSFLVLVALALMILPIRFELSKAETVDSSAIIQPVTQETPEILSRPVYAYLAEERPGLASPAIRPVNDTVNRLSVARTLADQKQFEKALTILGNVKQADAPSYDVRFLQARIMSWAGSHANADDLFLRLRSEFPHDPDVMVSYGYSQFYQGQFQKAEYLFSQVLIGYPGFADARSGLNKVRKARQQR